SRNDADAIIVGCLYVIVDANIFRPDQPGHLSFPEYVRVRYDGAAEVPVAQAVDWIGVPDAADVETAADEAADGFRRFDLPGNDDVRRVNSGLRAEVTAAAAGESEAVARYER